MGVAWRIVAGIHYCCCINYHDVRTCVFVCVYMRVCSDKHRRRTQNSHPGRRRGCRCLCTVARLDRALCGRPYSYIIQSKFKWACQESCSFLLPVRKTKGWTEQRGAN